MSEIRGISLSKDNEFNNLTYFNEWLHENSNSEQVNEINSSAITNTSTHVSDEVQVTDEINEVNVQDNITPEYNVDKVALDVIQGKYSTGAERESMLTAAGYDYNTVQARVNEIIPIYLVAYDVIDGKYSVGEERKRLLAAAGYDYATVQNMVNLILNIDVVHPTDEVETPPVVETPSVEEIVPEQPSVEEEVVPETTPEVEDVVIEESIPENQSGLATSDGGNVVDIETEVATDVEEIENNASSGNLQTENVEISDDSASNINMDALVDYAEKYIGAGDNPLGYGYHWCLAFVSYCLRNNPAFSDIQGFDLTQTSCSAQVAYINSHNPDAFHLMPGNYNGVESSSYEPKPGDIFFIENNEYDRGQYVVRHVGIVSEVNRDESGNIVSITTVEGNVNGSSSAYYNTSEVANKTYLVDSQGRYCLESSSGTPRSDFVIYGFFDTASAVV